MLQKIWLITFCACLSLPVWSQNTLEHTADEKFFTEALELFEKGKYSAAQRQFHKYLQRNHHS